MDIIIIGAGATGLLAARELAKAGKKVLILEARDRAGGRILTINDASFDLPVELGAEFIHGDLELTKSLLREADIDFYAIKGGYWNAENGILEESEMLTGEKEVIKKLKSLERDMSVQEFLDTYFSDERHAELRETLTNFVQGYDAADVKHASSFSLLQELLADDTSDQYRISGGYMRLVEYLVNECQHEGCSFEYSAVVSGINWQDGTVTVTTDDNRTFTASKVIVTLPLSVLQSAPDAPAHVAINPLPPEKLNAINALGITGVIKVVLQFNNPFWKNSRNSKGDNVEEIGFVFTRADIPTWWTQLPEDNSMITGWLAGPVAFKLKDLPEEEILQKALQSLSHAFGMDIHTIQSQLKAHRIANWTAETYTLGAYGYERVESKQAKRILNAPSENTLYFAGEALNEGPDHGTVEGALRSAEFVVSQVLK